MEVKDVKLDVSAYKNAEVIDAFICLQNKRTKMCVWGEGLLGIKPPQMVESF